MDRIKPLNVREAIPSSAECIPFCIPRSSLTEDHNSKEGNQFFVSEPVAFWARLGLNQRLLPCEGSTLPLSYAPVEQWVSYGKCALLSRGN